MSTSVATAETAAMPVDLSGTAPAPVKEPVFEIGLVMAGALSAGAYTAGVVDFLFEALNNWYDPKLQRSELGWQGPTPIHEVRLKTMAGASAGGMCAALTAISLLDGNTNRFKKAWVEDIDITKLLNSDDLKQYSRLSQLQSALNCEPLQQIADQAVTIPNALAPWPGWLGKQFDFYLTLTNLNGLTYEVEQQGGTAQRFISHADRIQYRMIKPGEPMPETDPALRVLRVAPQSQLTDQEIANWHELKEAALATGAFPIALLNRPLSFRNEYYDKRAWWYGSSLRPGHISRAVAPDEESDESPYKETGAPYLFVDGGMINNEPVELVRRTLTGDLTGKEPNPPGSEEAKRALLMIDPFPSRAKEGVYAELQRELPSVLGALKTVLMNQASFRAEDLLGALDLDKHSRFLIAPVRKSDVQGPSDRNLASSTAYGFGGFLYQAFREHDYQLGRRNCQKFLGEWFTLSAHHNPLFKANWSAELIEKFAVPGSGEKRLPILPLLGSSAVEVPAPDWQQARMPAAKLEQQIGKLLEKRLTYFTDLLQAELPEWWMRIGYSWLVKRKIRRKAQEYIIGSIKKELSEVGLLGS